MKGRSLDPPRAKGRELPRRVFRDLTSSVLITGAGGFIGSALARAIAAAGPERIILLDSSEQNLFAIDRRLDADCAEVRREAVLGSVTDAGLMDRIFARFHPRVVYHAAALKHVPLLERNPVAAVRENALGTYTLVNAAVAHGPAVLVLISTDKAVNPRSIMGASKRLAELTVCATGQPRMNAVRLGNVFGSTGSVVPIFRQQIRRGGPVTVTHPDAKRYFITLREAVAAILAAGSVDCAGRILLPDLGESRSIVDLARALIGSREVPIRFIGLRPGEKLNEDLMYRDEAPEGRVAGGLEAIRTPVPDLSELRARMAEIACLLARGDLAGILEVIRALVPEYEPSSTIRGGLGEAVP